MGAQKPIFQVYLDLIGESITAVDETLRNNVYRRKQWTIVKKDQASVLCSVVRIRYQKTLFQNKNTGERKTSLSEDVSRQMVMNKVHALQFQAEEPCIGEKKKARFLYIDADEDHVALQYDLAQGNLRKNAGVPCRGTCEPRFL